MEDNIRFFAEFIILSLDDKPEDNFRKVAEKEIRLFVVEKPIEKMYSLYGGVLDISGRSVDDAIKCKLHELNSGLADADADVHTEILNVSDKIINKEHTIKFTVLTVIRKNCAKLLNRNTSVQGYWVWVDIVRDTESSSIVSAKLKNNLYNPTIVIDRLYESGLEKMLQAVERIRADLYFSDILFKFMCETFTLKEFEESFNTLNGREVTNIKKKWAYKFIDTGMTSEGLAHRPAKIYRLNKGII